jgi:DNA-binding response OmpR family regulator
MKSVVLLADSDVVFRETVCNHLDSRGYKTLAVSSGMEVLKFASMADLFVLELELEGLSGFDVIRKLRSWGNFTPVIVVSNSNDLLKQAEDFDVVFSLRKPFDLEELSGCVDSAISAKKQLDYFHGVAHELMEAVDSWSSTAKKFREMVPA